MTDKIITATIEILGRPYFIRCLETEAKSLTEAAKLVNQKMTEVKDSGKAINLERIAIITALNIANQFLQYDQQKTKVNHRITQLQDKLESAMNKTLQTELLYTTE